MFNFLKDKLKDWTKKIAGAEETEEEKPEVKKEKKSKSTKKKEKQKEKSKKQKQTLSETEKEVISKATLTGVGGRGDGRGIKPSKEKEELKLDIPEEVQEKIKEIEDAEKVQETILKEEEKELKEKKGFFTKLKEKLTKEEDVEIPIDLKEKIEKKSEKNIIYKFKEKVTKTSISEEEINNSSEELELLLLENNVAYEVVQKIIKELKFELMGSDFSKKNLEEEIKKALKVIITNILVEPLDIEKEIKNRKDKSNPFVMLFCGINGTGKTTTVAKIAHFFQKKGISCILAGADTFRAASIEQIKKHGEALNIKVIAHDYGSDPASVGFDAISYAKKHSIDCVLIDTAGRMHTEKNLLKEIEKISRVTNPNFKIFVGESITGNDMIEQAKAFDSAISLDGIVLTKADIDEKGGAALSIGYITKKPIIYLGTGQKYEDIEKFSKDKFIEKLGL